jgi:hypothetical protein
VFASVLAVSDFRLLSLSVRPVSRSWLRYDRTWLLRTTGVFVAAATAGLGILVRGPSLGLWPLLLVAFLIGCAHAINRAVRRGRVHDRVGPDHLMSALAFLGFVESDCGDRSVRAS